MKTNENNENRHSLAVFVCILEQVIADWRCALLIMFCACLPSCTQCNISVHMMMPTHNSGTAKNGPGWCVECGAWTLRIMVRKRTRLISLRFGPPLNGYFVFVAKGVGSHSFRLAFGMCQIFLSFYMTSTAATHVYIDELFFWPIGVAFLNACPPSAL